MDKSKYINPKNKVKEGPWGKFEQFLDSELGTLKFVYINKGEKISLQMHKT